MPQYLSPGVYVEEVSSGSKPIAGVGTAVGAFLGIAEKGPVGKATLITSWSAYLNTFGGFISDAYLPMAVYQFFNEGGASCFVVRTVHYREVKTSDHFAKLSKVTIDSIDVEASSEGTWGDNISVIVTPSTVVPGGFRLLVLFKGRAIEQFDNLTTQNAELTVNNASAYIHMNFNGAMPAIPAVTGLPSAATTNFTASGVGASTKNGSLSYTQKIGIAVDIKITLSAEPGEFKLEVLEAGKSTVFDSFDKLTLLTVEDKVNKSSQYVNVRVNPLTGGDNGLEDPKAATPDKLNANDFIGSPAEGAKNGLYAFDEIDEINNLAMPDMHHIDKTSDNDTIALVKAGLSYCENRGDVFFIADAPNESISPMDMKSFKMDNLNSTFGAIYYPWIQVFDPLNPSNKILTPPCGAIAGIYARTDINRGVHKAPAGTVDGYMRTPVGLARVLSKGEHDVLNEPGINVIRYFPGQGICVWGARTLTMDAEWKYISVRRLFLYLEESIDQGTQWVVFEPNTPALWGNVKRNLTAFLSRVWRDGALFGLSEEEAFYIKVDAENNPPAVRDAGQLIIEIGVAPVKPAEFVVIRISQKTLVA
jgi:hypothetical protein